MTSEETVWVSGELAGLPTVESCGVGPLVENLGWKKAYDYVEKHGTPAKHGGLCNCGDRGPRTWFCSFLDHRLMCNYCEGCIGKTAIWSPKPGWLHCCSSAHLKYTFSFHDLTYTLSPDSSVIFNLSWVSLGRDADIKVLVCLFQPNMLQ